MLDHLTDGKVPTELMVPLSRKCESWNLPALGTDGSSATVSASLSSDEPFKKWQHMLRGQTKTPARGRFACHVATHRRNERPSPTDSLLKRLRLVLSEAAYRLIKKRKCGELDLAVTW